MKAPPFGLARDASGGVRVTGAISYANARRALAQMPTPEPGAALTVDLAALDGSDSATLAVLIAWSAAARRAGATLHYASAPQALRNLAHLCEVETLLELA